MNHIPIALQNDARLAVYLTRYIPNVIVKLGEHGVIYARRAYIEAAQPVWVRHYAALPSPQIISVTGAGDSFVGAFLAGLAKYGDADVDRLVNIAQHAAIATLASDKAVSDDIGPSLLDILPTSSTI
jgi:sugar/nucleoside kinase (ribokinase family)